MASTVLPNGIIIPEKFSRDWYADLYHNWQELDNLLGGGTPKDGTLTIQKNGTAVGTFSANQATDETVNIEVPTATSELTNDSNFVQSSDLATVATSGSYNDLSNKPTIPTVNDATLTIQQNGTTVDTFTANSSTDKMVNIQCVDLTNNQTVAGNKEFTGTTTAHDLVPSATDTYNFGSSTAQWNNAYAKNYFYNGVAWGLDKVNTWTAQQNIAGGNYRGVISIYNSAYTKGSALSSTDLPIGTIFMGDGGQTGIANSLSFISTDLASNGARTMLSLSAMENTASSTNRANFVVSYDKNDAENPRKVTIQGTVIPHPSVPFSLGTSTNKWKSFNGINPGALSLPGTFVNVDTTNWVLDGSNVNIFTPTSDGWLGIQATDTVYDQMHYVFVGRTGGGNTYYQQNALSPINALWDSKYHGCILIPVIKGISYHIRCICGSVVATFYPCQGNV